jgi:hypothetical protein
MIKFTFLETTTVAPMLESASIRLSKSRPNSQRLAAKPAPACLSVR